MSTCKHTKNCCLGPLACLRFSQEFCASLLFFSAGRYCYFHQPHGMMKAAHLNGWCAVGTVPDTLSFGQVPAPPAPRKSEVLIKVKASAINVDDIAICQDTGGGGWYFHGRQPASGKPFIAGCEYAGVVLAAGPDCKKLKIGDRVCGVQDTIFKKLHGTWAEQMLAPEDDVVPMPADNNYSFVDAAALGMAAHVSGDMFKMAQKKGTFPEGAGRCLVLGASGGLGTVLLQLLTSAHRGLHIVAVCSGSNAGLVKRHGAAEVVDYTSGPFAEQLAGADKFDVVFDFVGGTDAEKGAEQVLRKGGKFITAVGPMRAIGDRKLSFFEWHGWALSLTGRILGSYMPRSRYGYEMSAATIPLKSSDFHAAVEAGARAEISLEVPFEDAPLREALRKVASRHTGGKVVINMELRGGADVASVSNQ